MKKYRQWLAETEDHMTESPDGTYYLVSDVEKMEAEKDRVLQESCVILAEGIKVVENLEQQIAALETAVKEKDEVIEAFEAMKEGVTDRVSDLEAAVHEWQDIAGQWEDKCQKLTEQIAALTATIEFYEKNRTIQTINSLTAELKSLTEAYNNTDWKKINDDQKDTINTLTVKWGKVLKENAELTAENTRLRERLYSHGDIQTDEEENALKGKEPEQEDVEAANKRVRSNKTPKVAPFSYENLKGIDES